MQHAIINAMKCMRDIKDRIARPVYKLANKSVEPLYHAQCINRGNHRSVIFRARQLITARWYSDTTSQSVTTPMIALDFSGMTTKSASHNVVLNQLIQPTPDTTLRQLLTADTRRNIQTLHFNLSKFVALLPRLVPQIHSWSPRRNISLKILRLLPAATITSTTTARRNDVTLTSSLLICKTHQARATGACCYQTSVRVDAQLANLWRIDSDLVIYRTTLVRTFQVVTICRVDKSEVLVVLISPHDSKLTLAMSLFDLQDVCIAIGSIATLDLPMVVDLIGIYGLKGPYCTLTTTNLFLQALSVIPRGSWGDVARRFTMIRWATLSTVSPSSLLQTPPPPVVTENSFSGQLGEENPFVQNSSVFLVQPDEGVSVLVVDRIGDYLPQSTEKSRVLVIPVGARHKCQQGIRFQRPMYDDY
ncbi:hypothetical protein F511_22824 [Dorcoceras hygrometricum]|uniref:Uncharacterized protein n=1 Tax=Dorcoceras hygrometricum TaxID=472368 RepID=A0A2Z7B6V4_9LAMI|nr:hypothetical protein F511_22824 [Dorcoceras hygrometricum]